MAMVLVRLTAIWMPPPTAVWVRPAVLFWMNEPVMVALMVLPRRAMPPPPGGAPDTELETAEKLLEKVQLVMVTWVWESMLSVTALRPPPTLLAARLLAM